VITLLAIIKSVSFPMISQIKIPICEIIEKTKVHIVNYISTLWILNLRFDIIWLGKTPVIKCLQKMESIA